MGKYFQHETMVTFMTMRHKDNQTRLVLLEDTYRTHFGEENFSLHEESIGFMGYKKTSSST